jgi:putative ATPase
MKKQAPIADILRPSALSEFIGQDHLVGEGRAFRKMIDRGMLRSIIFYGPAGTGKTSLANVIANMLDCYFCRLNATSSGVKDIRSVIKSADGVESRQTVLFLDEIANLNKTQQDILLPPVESGKIILIGATTQNPFFSINGPLISRSQVFEFEPLEPEDIKRGIARVVAYYRDLNKTIKITKKAVRWIINMSGGDLRRAMNAIQAAVEITDLDDITIKEDLIMEIIPIKGLQFDGYGEEHYDMASCVQGAIQASDPDAAVYWLARWIASGENPDYICRRLLIASAEDVGIENPMCMTVTNAATDMVRKTGIEGDGGLALANAVIMMATSRRNKTVAKAFWAAQKDVREGADVVVPKEMKDCHYRGATKLGRGSYHDGMKQENYVGIKKKYYRPL